jgi:hypothetical protein
MIRGWAAIRCSVKLGAPHVYYDHQRLYRESNQRCHDPEDG